MLASKALFLRAKQFIPGGVNSPVRSFSSVGGEPIFFAQGNKASLLDVDGKTYIDYVNAWGALIAGHAPESVVRAVCLAAEKGLSFGASIAAEANLAEKITLLMPSIKKLRLTNSGTEACMTAIRLARGFTGRHKILKFNGCYHGHVDALLVEAGSGVASLAVPSSAGIPSEVLQQTITVDFNNLEQVTQAFIKHGKEIAAVIVEPVAANMSCIPPLAGFLSGLRELCDHYGSLLIFDEVITGFRVGLGGAQALYQVWPDLTTLGKIIGGGLPVGAVGGRSDVMDYLAPDGPVYQAGTLSGNPIAVAAGLATLELVSEPDFYTRLAATTRHLIEEMLQLAKKASIPLQAHYVGGLFGLFFSEEKEIYNYKQVKQSDFQCFRWFFHEMLAQGVYLAPSPFESGFVSSAHQDSTIEATLMAVKKVFDKLSVQEQSRSGTLFAI